MFKYLCEKCGRDFKQKCHLHNHINKKIPCIKIEKQNDNENIRKELEKIRNENMEIKNETDQLKKEIEELKNTKDIIINDVNIINDVSINNNNINITNNFNVIKLLEALT